MLSYYTKKEVKVQNTMRAYWAGFYTSVKAVALNYNAKPLRVQG